jgi:hypothetical protein
MGLVIAAATCWLAACGTACAAVRLASPPDDVSVASGPVFTWNAVRGTDHYELQLAADERFASSVLGGRSNSLKTANTAATLSKHLADGTYYWRVRAVTAAGRAGRWSTKRSFAKAWANAPTLMEPNDLFEVIWPIAPLRLQWSSVPNAVAYSVVVGTDPTLAAPIIGGTKSPVETQGTTLALPNALAPGAYYWAVTPKDANGHSGRQSAVGSFDWTWPSQTTPTLNDLNSDPRVLDPQFSWTAVPGAARYEVEVNPSHDWTPASKVCCDDPTIGTSLSPTSLLANNTYYWRLRAIDAQGDVGVWNEGPSFQKDFDPVGPQVPSTVPNLRIRDNGTDPAGSYPVSTSNPILQWDPVPGASSYEVQLLAWTGSACDLLDPVRDLVVYGLAWTPTATPPSTHIGPTTWPNAHGSTTSLATGSYCIRVLAQSENKNGFISDWTWLNGTGNQSLVYTSQPAPGVERNPFQAIGSDYLGALSPPSTACIGGGSVPCTTRLPLFTWQRIDGATGYYVVVARDQLFTQVVDVAFTQAPAYAVLTSKPSGSSYTDETTHYYWAILPYNGNVTDPSLNSPQPFDKQSIPPQQLAPPAGEDVNRQPIFNWGEAEGARSYRLQVASDPNFGDLFDDVTTDSTAYTSSTTYPVDTVLYWRVRAVDGRGVGLNWSASSTFRRRLPTPTLLGSNPLAGGDIPVLGWNSVPGALSYGMHVDYPGGQTKDLTVYSTLFTPVEFYGNGVWHWRVRANFPNGSGTSTVAGGYTSSTPFTRSIPAPTGALATRSAHRVLVTWDSDPHAYKYRLQTSAQSSFDATIESITTTGTSYAPTLSASRYRTGGRIYWRIASLDKGNNQGAFANGTFVLARSFVVRAFGLLRRGKPSRLVVTLSGQSSKAFKGTRITISGVGVKRRTKPVSRRGRVTFVIRPKRRGALTILVHKRGYTDVFRTVTVR